MSTQATRQHLPLTLQAPSRAQWLGLPEYVRHPTFQFWALQAIGWSGWAGAVMASGVYWGMESAFNLAVLVGMATGMLLTGVLRELYRFTWDHPLWARILLLLCASYVVAALWQLSKNVALFEVYRPLLDMDEMLARGWSAYFRGTLSSFYIVLCWSGLYFGAKYYRMLLVERDRALAATAAAREAQLRMLRYQLNPHFLFNTLNAISTLILEGDNRRADLMVSRLSAFLRHSLDNDPMQKLLVAQEVAALRMYLEIEQARFEERLQVTFEIEPEAERALLPGLLLQPLVENAIKYAVAHREEGGHIRIRGRLDSGWLELEVEDDGPGLGSGVQARHSSTGLGLANIRERLRQVYGDRQSFRIEPAATGGLRVVIRLPHEPAGGGA